MIVFFREPTLSQGRVANCLNGRRQLLLSKQSPLHRCGEVRDFNCCHSTGVHVFLCSLLKCEQVAEYPNVQVMHEFLRVHVVKGLLLVLLKL